MKTGTETTWKFKALKSSLDLPAWQVKGLLESIWHLAAQHTPRGDIGRLTDKQIAISIEYAGDATAMVRALVECGFLDAHPQCRLVVHDWADHCPEFVRRRVMRSRMDWAVNDCAPDLSGQIPTNPDKSRHDATNPAMVEQIPTCPDLSGNVCLNLYQNQNQNQNQNLNQDQHQEKEGTYCAESSADSTPPVPPEPPLLVFPTEGKTKTWDFCQSNLDSLAQAFPSIDILAEARKALGWLMANHDRRKTARGMSKFLYGWLSRANNSGNAARLQPGEQGGEPKVKMFLAGKPVYEGEIIF